MEHKEPKEGLGLGMRFHPTDSEALSLLLRFVAKQAMNDSGFITTNVNVYGKQQEPWKVYSRGVNCEGTDDNYNYDSSESYRYFITKKIKMTCHDELENKGSWKIQYEGRPVYRTSSSTLVIGFKKSMRYYMIDNKEDKDDGEWLVKEFELSDVILKKFDEDRRDYVLCAIKKKPIEETVEEMEESESES